MMGITDRRLFDGAGNLNVSAGTGLLVGTGCMECWSNQGPLTTSNPRSLHSTGVVATSKNRQLIVSPAADYP